MPKHVSNADSKKNLSEIHPLRDAHLADSYCKADPWPLVEIPGPGTKIICRALESKKIFAARFLNVSCLHCDLRT